MNEETKLPALSDEALDYIQGLYDKAVACNEKTSGHANLTINLDGYTIPLRVDDRQLFFVGAALLPNIVNYLVNVLPQLLYPYIVAYLQELSGDIDDPISVSQLYDVVKSVVFPSNVE